MLFRSNAAPPGRSRSTSVHESQAVDRRQSVTDVVPALALVFANEQVAASAAERECSAIGIDVEPMPVHEVAGMWLRPPAGERGRRQSVCRAMFCLNCGFATRARSGRGAAEHVVGRQ